MHEVGKVANFNHNKKPIKMTRTTIKNLKVGDFFTLKYYDDTEREVSEKVVWVRGEYDRSTKTFSCYKFSDVCHERFFKGTKECFTDIYF